MTTARADVAVAVAVVAVTLAVAGGDAAALDPARAPTQYVHERWSVDRGLPQSSVYAIARTPDGYLWLGTEEGLCRFDGLSFTVYDREASPLFDHNLVQTLLVDRTGALWIGLFESGVLRLRNGRFERVDAVPREQVTAMVEDASGAVWVGLERSGLVRVGADGRATRVRTTDGLPSDAVRALAVDDDGGLWVATFGGGLARLGARTPEVWRAADGLPDDRVTRLARDRGGRLWIGTERGLARLDPGARTPVPALALAGRPVRALAADRAGSLWVGTFSDGLFRLRDDGVEALGPREGAPGRIESLYEDHLGSLWIGTNGAGLHRLRDGKVLVLGAREGLSHEVTWSVTEDPAGALWVGTEDGLNQIAGAPRRRVTARVGTDGGLPARGVVGLAADAGGLWITNGGDAVTRRERDGRLRTIALPATATALLAGDDGLWVATRGAGLVRLHASGSVADRLDAAHGLPSDEVEGVGRLADGTLWAATFSGLAVRTSDGRAARLGPPADAPRGAAAILAVHGASARDLWVGTSVGLYRVRGERWTLLGRAHGLRPLATFALVADAGGRLWLATNQGLAHLDPRAIDALLDGGRGPHPAGTSSPSAQGSVGEVAVGWLDALDGMRSRECNRLGQPAAIAGSDGTLWFTTVAGVVAVPPASAAGPPSPPPRAALEALLGDQRPRELAAPSLLAPGTRRIEFLFTATGLSVAERARFRYRLDGFDRDWVDAGGRRRAAYTNVMPGDYRFQVVTADEDGAWSPAGAAVALRLQPFFWQTRWFVALCLAGGLGLAAGAYRVRVTGLRRRAVELGRLVDERTAHLGDALARLADANRRLEELAQVDVLTGIANRRRFDAHLATEWRRALRSGTQLSLLLVDVDFFKLINDTYGHQEGDRVLAAVARALAGCARRTTDLAARYGGEEFAAVLPDTDAEGASHVGESVRAAVAALAIPHRASKVAAHVTVSVGVATLVPPRDEPTPERLIAIADRGLYAAKHAGRDRVEAGDPTVT